MTTLLNNTSNPGLEEGWTPLMCAADAGDIGTVTEILTENCDIDIDARDYTGCTSLVLAAQKGHTAVVDRLLVHGANPNLRDLDGFTPLWKAAQNGHTSVVQLLLADKKLSDVNPRPEFFHEYKWETPLSIALKEGHQEIVELLLRTDGIDPWITTIMPNRRFQNRTSILGLAIRSALEDVSLFVLDRFGTENMMEPISLLLVLAAAAGCSRIIQKLLTKHDADINAVDGYEDRGQRFVDSPLVAASRNGHLDTVRLLLDVGEINPGVKSSDGGTALTVAAEGGFVDVVELLVSDGRIDVDLKNGDGRTALSFAAEIGSEALVDQLLATGAADPGVQDSWGRTPLIWAIKSQLAHKSGERQSYEVVIRKLLADSRTNVNAMDFWDCTALWYAVKHGATKLVMALLEHPEIEPTVGPEHTSTLLAAAENGHVDLVQLLISDGRINVNTVLSIKSYMFGWSRTTLMAMVGYNRVECESSVQVLLSAAGIDVNFQDETGRTALMLAASHGTTGMVKLILTSGGNPNMQDHDGDAALHHARNIEIMEALLEDPEIKPDLPNNEGRTALSLAAEAGNIEFVNTLLANDAVSPKKMDVLGRGPLPWVFGQEGIQSSLKKKERIAVLQRLLQISDINPNAEDHDGLTPLLLAIMSNQSDQYVEILLSRPDLDVNRPGIGGRDSPLDTAKHMGNMATIALLRKRGAIESKWVLDEGCQSSAYSLLEIDPLRQQSLEKKYSMINRLEMTVMREYRLYLGQQQAHVDVWAENPARLCSLCLDIDLGSAFWTRHTQYEGRVIADLGRVNEAWAKRDCSLCRLFAAVHPPTKLGEGHKLVSFSTTQSWLCQTRMARWEDFLLRKFADTMLLAVVPADTLIDMEPVRGCGMGPSRRAEDVVKAAFCSGLIGRLGRNGRSQSSVTIPRLAAEISDWSIARDWITLCRENHSEECNPRRTVTVPHFFLIECSTRKIKEQKQAQTGGPPPYVALSYVWGQSQGSQQQPKRQRQQESLDGKGDGAVEPAIEDAIRVTLELGYEYLWVDRYCIVQNGDEAIKKQQLQHMHLVYANAEVTLIAAAGKDSSAGLPGVPGRPRKQQIDAFIQGHALVTIPPDPSLHIQSRSTWATRGWTYQEGLLARRRLYFSEFEMSYECRHMLCREAIRLPRGLEQRISGHKPRFMEPFWMYQPYAIPGMDSSGTGLGLFELLEAYSKRKLSLPSDALNAMLGIFSLLAQHKTTPIYHICGVPIMRLPKHDKLRSRKRRRYSITTSNNGDTGVTAASSLAGFLDGLCWRLQEPAYRRPGFPSWSWTGWQGVVATMSENVSAIQPNDEFVIEVSIVPNNQDGVAVPWNSYYDQLRMADDSRLGIQSGQQYILEIAAGAAPVRFHKGEYDGRHDTWIGTIFGGHNIWQGEFFLDRKDLLLSSLLRKTWTVVQERKYKQEHRSEQGHIYCERVGLLRLVSSKLEGVWHDVVPSYNTH
ncbi:hypothetical protein FLONG3_5336 [Fusarium longipes]|uniref:Heterokaryon incompatibility domain-containing protein n=1 Tax=Fusarium longipes TaxID=694270 RepID=A0A395SWH6_9HYPO|nr:hypothetical protein FLONG3_5336 [Fusarium longipes]